MSEIRTNSSLIGDYTKTLGTICDNRDKLCAEMFMYELSICQTRPDDSIENQRKCLQMVEISYNKCKDGMEEICKYSKIPGLDQRSYPK